MTTLREAAQQALEALEHHGGHLPWNAFVEVRKDLRAALTEHYCDTHCTWADHAPGCVRAEPVQEPAAWSHNLIAGNVITHRPADIDRHPDRWTALYPAPQPCPTCEALARTVMLDQTSHDTAPPQHKPLTEEEITQVLGNVREQVCGAVFLSFARAIERAHGIGGNNESA